MQGTFGIVSIFLSLHELEDTFVRNVIDALDEQNSQ